MTDQAGQKQSGRFQPGQSGNPNGRPKGSGKIAQLRASIESHVPDIIRQLVGAAKAGDVAAARLLLERAIPPVKASEEPVQFPLPDGGLTDKGRAVVEAIAAGELPAAQGASVLSALGTLAKLTEIDELERRIAALEQQPKR